MKRKYCFLLALAACCALLFALHGAAAAAGCPLRGDADGDGIVTAADAREILRCSVGLAAPAPERVPFCSVYLPGVYTAQDARYVLRLSVGLEDAPDHVPGEGKTIRSATCTDAQLIEQPCLCCGAPIISAGAPAAGHQPGEWQVLLAADCIHEGLRERRCRVCGEVTQRETLPKTEHSYGGMQCDQTLNCTRAQNVYYVCAVCGDRRNEIKYPSPHDIKWVTTIAPTCTASGLREEMCVICGFKTGNAEGLPGGKGHVLSAWEIVIAPTTANPGKRIRRCLRCEQIIEEEILEKLS